MSSATAPRSQALWLLVLIDLSGGRVEGITRLQKMAFLMSQLIHEVQYVGFYNDWIASRYGPFSPSLRDDTGVLERYGLLHGETVELPPFAHMEVFVLTQLGQQQAETLEKSYSKLTETIRKMITSKYANAPLMSLLHDVYYMFPQYSTESEIADDVYDP